MAQEPLPENFLGGSKCLHYNNLLPVFITIIHMQIRIAHCGKPFYSLHIQGAGPHLNHYLGLLDEKNELALSSKI